MADDQTTAVAPPPAAPATTAPSEEGLLHSLATSFGIDPEAVKATAKAILANPGQAAKEIGSQALTEIGNLAEDPINAAIKTAKGVGSALTNPDAQETAKTHLKSPGIRNKVTGTLEGATSLIPIVGGNLVKSEDQYARGNWRGGTGTLLGTIAPMLLPATEALPDTIHEMGETARENMAARSAARVEEAKTGKVLTVEPQKALPEATKELPAAPAETPNANITESQQAETPDHITFDLIGGKEVKAPTEPVTATYLENPKAATMKGMPVYQNDPDLFTKNYGSGQEWYHGTTADFENFQHDNIERGTTDWNSQLGTHFAADANVAQEFADGRYSGKTGGKVIPAKLNIQNPKTYDVEGDMGDDALRAALDNGVVTLAEVKKVKPDFDPSETYHEGNGIINALKNKRNQIAANFKQSLRDQGHDGIIYGNVVEGSFGNKTAIALHPEQIERTDRVSFDSLGGTKIADPTPRRELNAEEQMRVEDLQKLAAESPNSVERRNAQKILETYTGPERRAAEPVTEPEDIITKETQSELKEPYGLRVTNPDGTSQLVRVGAFSPKNAIAEAQKKFPEANQWEIVGAGTRGPASSTIYSVPTGKHLSMPVSGDIPPVNTFRHEISHALIGQKEGLVQKAMIRHTHPEASSNTRAAIRWNAAGLYQPGTRIVKPEKLPALIRTFMGGIAGDEVFNKTPREKNHNFSIIRNGDGGQSYQILLDVGYGPHEALAYMHKAIDDNKEYLQHPAIQDIVKENEGTREPNLSTQYHYSSERLQQMHQEAQRRIANGTTKLDNGTVSGENAGERPEDVPGGEGEGAGSTGQAVQEKGLTTADLKKSKEAPEVLESIAKEFGTSTNAAKAAEGASIIQPDGKFIHLPAGEDHPAVIASHGYSKDTPDDRVGFINESGAIRTNFRVGKAGRTLAVSVPSDGVTPEQVDSIKQAVGQGLGRNGNLIIESAASPTNMRTQTKEFATPADVEPLLEKIGALPKDLATNDLVKPAPEKKTLPEGSKFVESSPEEYEAPKPEPTKPSASSYDIPYMSAPPDNFFMFGSPEEHTSQAGGFQPGKWNVSEADKGPEYIAKELRRVANEYNADHGRPAIKTEAVQEDPRSSAIADSYKNAVHAPNDKAVKKSYDALKRDIDEQYDLAKSRGIKMDVSDTNPYGLSESVPAHEELHNDVLKNKHLSVWSGGAPPADHPLSAVDPKTGFTYNEKFRMVHDIFGHAAEKNDFSPAGEESAWNLHRQMFSPEARPALATETKGQAAYTYKYGDFPPQKAALLPAEHQVRPEDIEWQAPAAKLAKKNDAGAIDPNTGKTDTKGVGVEVVPELRQPLDHKPTAQDFQDFYAKHQAIFNAHPELRVGWDNATSGAPGGHELNVGAVGPEAARVAKKLDQKAAFDIGKGENIETGGSGTRTEFPNYPIEERLKDLRGENQSDIKGFEHLSKDIYDHLEPDERDYLKDNKVLQRNVMSQYHRIQPSVAETTNAMQAGAALGGWWKRYIDVFHNLAGEDGAPLGEAVEGPKIAHGDLQDFTQAVQNTPGAKLEGNKLTVRATRYQKLEQAGEKSVRTGVFYLPETGSPYARYYKNKSGTAGYGGSQRLEGDLTLQNPLIAKGASGGTVPERAYDALQGKGAYAKMRTDVLQVGSTPLFLSRNPTIQTERVATVLRKYGANPDLAEYIIQKSLHGNQLAYAIQENIVAHAVRAAGYDGIVGYSQLKGQPRLSEIFHVSQDTYPAEMIANAIGPSHAEVLKQWHAAVSGNKSVKDANNLAWHTYADWLDAGKPTDRKSINDIVKANASQPEGSEKKGNTAIFDTFDRKGRLREPGGLDTGKLFRLINSPEMRGERPFRGDVYRDDPKNPLMGSTKGARKIPSMGATVAGKGNLNRLVIDTHIRDFYGQAHDGPAPQYIADSAHLRQAAEALGLKGGEGQEQLWGTVLGLKTLLKEGLTPAEAGSKLDAETIRNIGKDYAEVIANDPEITRPGGLLDRLKDKYGIGRGAAGISEANRQAPSAGATGKGGGAGSEAAVDKTQLAKTAERIRGTISDTKIKKPAPAPKSKGIDAMAFIRGLDALKKPSE